MFQYFRKYAVFLVILLTAVNFTYAQKTEKVTKPFSGTSPFRKFSIGIDAGLLKSSVIAGGSNDYSNNIFNFGYGLNVKYQLTHSIAIQADFIRGKMSGDQSKEVGTDSLNLYRPITAFKSDLNIAASINAIYTFGNINWLRIKNRMVPYIGIGAGLANVNVRIKRLGSTAYYEYPYGKKNDLTELFIPVSMGVKFKITKQLNLDIGYRMHYTDADNLDGFAYWDVPNGNSSTVHKDKFSYTHIGLEYVFGKKTKGQLMFDNPAARLKETLQDQINNLSAKVDSLANKQKGLEDFDGDSVSDLFDKEPNTPAGCPVDAQGVMRDTDGDGIPDCKDKQLITPTECQPVDADGVGKCPDPECCKSGNIDRDNDNGKDLNANCPSDYPSISFRGNSIRPESEGRATIAAIAAKLKTRPECKLMIKGYPETSKSSQAICQKRVDAIKLQLVEREGISADRITTNCEVGGGDKNTVEIISN